MAASKKGADRRRWERLPLAIPVFVRGLDPHGKQFVDFATALDISVGGALLAIHRHLPEGSKIMLEIPSAPTLHNHQNPKVPRAVRQNFYAKAVRVTNNDTCHLMGLQFQKPLKTPQEPAKPKAIAKRKSASSV
jgi:hypothetical protein